MHTHIVTFDMLDTTLASSSFRNNYNDIITGMCTSYMSMCMPYDMYVVQKHQLVCNEEKFYSGMSYTGESHVQTGVHSTHNK